jgi:hemoglobin
MMHRQRAYLVAAIGSLGVFFGENAALAQSTTVAPVTDHVSVPVAPAQYIAIQPGTALYDHLGGKDGISTIVTIFIKDLLADQRIAATFDGVDLDRLQTKLVEQFCMLSAGPCRYSGKEMAEVHEDLKITNAHFNALVEDLQHAMEQVGIPSRYQNQLLAKLAPMQRAIVTK